jgi:hypothetical protein
MVKKKPVPAKPVNSSIEVLASSSGSTEEAGKEGGEVGVQKGDEYAYDSSDEEDIRNTIGNIPTNWYDEYGHIGYDLEGKKIRNGHDCTTCQWRFVHGKFGILPL